MQFTPLEWKLSYSRIRCMLGSDTTEKFKGGIARGIQRFSTTYDSRNSAVVPLGWIWVVLINHIRQLLYKVYSNKVRYFCNTFK